MLADYYDLFFSANQGGLGKKEIAIILAVSTAYFLFQSYCLSSDYQTTPGGYLLGLKVQTEDGQSLSFATAMLRTILATFVSYGVLFGLGYLVSAFTRKNQTLHDIVANTHVTTAKDSSNLKYFGLYIGINILVVVTSLVLVLFSAQLIKSSKFLERDPSFPMAKAYSQSKSSLIDKLLNIEGVENPKYLTSSKKVKTRTLDEKLVLTKLSKIGLPRVGNKDFIGGLGLNGIGVYRYGKGIELKTKNKFFFHFLDYKLKDHNNKEFQLLMSRADDGYLSHRYTLAGLDRDVRNRLNVDILYPKKLTIVYFSKNDAAGSAFKINKDTTVQLKASDEHQFKFVVQGTQADFDKIKFVPFSRDKVALSSAGGSMESGDKKSVYFSSPQVAFVAMLYSEKTGVHKASISIDPYIN